METKVVGTGTTKRVGRWTLAQLRQTDGIIPSQAGWNKGDSQKLMTNFGTPRNTATRVKSENLQVRACSCGSSNPLGKQWGNASKSASDFGD